MGITKLTADVMHISKLPTEPNIENGYTPEVLKGKFDEAGSEIKAFINESFIPELESYDTVSGADRIGSGEIEGLDGSTVQEKLENLNTKVNSIVNAEIPDGSITPDKFVTSVADFMTSGSLRRTIYKTGGTYTFIPTRTGVYKISATGGGAGGSIKENTIYSYGGGGGYFAESLVSLTKGTEYTVIVGAGGTGLTLDGNGYILARGTNGGESAFKLSDTVLVSAPGGIAASNDNISEDSAVGDIVIKGGIPRYIRNGNFLPVEYNFNAGGDSHLGRGSVSSSDTPGIGGGGYGGYYTNGNHIGYNGGDGAVIIDYIK